MWNRGAHQKIPQRETMLRLAELQEKTLPLCASSTFNAMPSQDEHVSRLPE